MNLIDVVLMILANAINVCPTCGPFDSIAHMQQLKPLPPLWDNELSRHGKAGIAEDDRVFGKKKMKC